MFFVLSTKHEIGMQNPRKKFQLMSAIEKYNIQS